MFAVILGQFFRFVSKNTSVFCLLTLYRENALQNGSLGRHGRIGKEGGGTCARWSSTLIAQVHPSLRPPVRPSVPRLSADFPFGHVVGVVRSAANALQCPIRRPHPSPSLRGGRSKGRNCSLSTNLKASSGDRLQARSPPAQRADGAQHGDGGRAIHARHALSWSVVAVNYTRMRWRPF